jgi:hypothetical protein
MPILQTVDPAVLRLARSALNRHEIVAVDRGGTSRHRARGSLGGIVLVSRNTMFRGHVRSRHLQQVELRRHLESRIGVRRVSVKRPNVA